MTHGLTAQDFAAMADGHGPELKQAWDFGLHRCALLHDCFLPAILHRCICGDEQATEQGA